MGVDDISDFRREKKKWRKHGWCAARPRSWRWNTCFGHVLWISGVGLECKKVFPQFALR
jgi:hypothetical protein